MNDGKPGAIAGRAPDGLEPDDVLAPGFRQPPAYSGPAEFRMNGRNQKPNP